MEKLKSASPFFALYRRELKHYASSSLYVVNTIIGPIMLAAAGIALFVAGEDALDNIIPIPGLADHLLPFLFAALCTLMPTTSSAISMEGRYWWLVRSLPVSTRSLLNAKLLVNLTLVVPCYIIAEAFLLLAKQPAPLEALWLLLYPALHCLLGSIAGLTFNLLFPVLNWKHEAMVVKQSAAAMLSMFTGILLPLGFAFLTIKLQAVDLNLLMAGICALTALAAMLLYVHNNRVSLKKIG